MDDFSDSDLGAPITYAQCELIPGSDTPMSLPVFSVPSGFSARPDQSSIQTVLALGTSSCPEVGSSAVAPQTYRKLFPGGRHTDGRTDRKPTPYVSPPLRGETKMCICRYSGGPGWPINNRTGPILLPSYPLTYINIHMKSIQ